MTDRPTDQDKPVPPAVSLAFRPAPEDPPAAAPLPEEVALPDEAALPDERGALPAARARPRAGLFVTIALLVATAGLVVALVLTALDLGDANSLAGARTGALAAARTYSVELAGYDYRHLSQDFGVVLSHSTASFRKSFSESSSALASTLTKYHATAEAKVVAAGVVSASANRVVVLVLLDQTVTNSTQRTPTVDRSQLEMTLVQSGGQWLIDQVQLL